MFVSGVRCKSWLLSTAVVCAGATSVCQILVFGMHIGNDNSGSTNDYGDLTKYNLQSKQMTEHFTYPLLYGVEVSYIRFHHEGCKRRCNDNGDSIA
jgi:hypothetical protein